ncbi:MAG TPA: hypothetical protein VKV26_13385 [Dehalococcoidia bacterium]|nr:hypothetical protein [Dehalococcoidia bacterium]
MSKLSEAIKRTTRAEAPQIGFAPAQTKPRATMLLAALIGPNAAAPEAADVLLIQGAAKAPAANGAKQEPVRGAWLDGAADAVQAREGGFDFIVFNGDEAPAAVLLEEDAGLVMQAPDELPDSLLQALQWLPIDALLVRWKGALTVRRQLELQRVSGFSRKPLFLFLANEPAGRELEALREAGVVGIVVDLGESGGEKRLAALRAAIDGLRPRPKRSRNDSGLLSVNSSMLTMAEPVQEDDDDDDDE